MNKELERDLGENYQYVKTIINNKIELAKLEMIEKVSAAAGNLVAVLAIIILIGLSLVVGFCLLGYLLITLVGSVLGGLGALLLILIVITTLLAMFRNSLFIEPIEKLILTKMYEDDRN